MAINLTKGQKIDLRKNSGDTLTNICVGVNWGAIEKKGFWGNTKFESVDLDASCISFDDNKNPLEVIYFGNLKSENGSIKHSGDDLVGDTGGDDGLDNEIISVDLTKIKTKSHFLRTIFHAVNVLKIPAPALEFNSLGKMKFRPIYF